MTIQRHVLSIAAALAGVAALLLASTNVSARAADGQAVIEAAAGQGTFSHDERLVARLSICQGALQVGVEEPAFIKLMKGKGFSNEAVTATDDVCRVLAYGVSLGFQLATAKSETVSK